jgi:hypothetical protein
VKAWRAGTDPEKDAPSLIHTVQILGRCGGILPRCHPPPFDSRMWTFPLPYPLPPAPCLRTAIATLNRPIPPYPWPLEPQLASIGRHLHRQHNFAILSALHTCNARGKI